MTDTPSSIAANEAPPISVPGSPRQDMVAAGLRSFGLVVAMMFTLAGLVSRHDVAGFVAYVQSSGFITAAGGMASAAIFVWGQWKTRHRSVQLSRVGNDPRVPDAVITVRQP